MMVALSIISAGCRNETPDTDGEASTIVGDDESLNPVACSAVSPRPAVTDSVMPGSSAVIQFAEAGRRHRLWIHGDLPGDKPFRFTLREMGGDTVGVEITADRKLPAKHWAILTMDYSGCPSARASRFKVGRKDPKTKELKSRGGAVDLTNQEVLGYLRGASEYILGAN